MLENSLKSQSESDRQVNWQRWGIGIVLLLLLSLASWFIISRNFSGLDLPPEMSHEAFEAQTGIRITLIAVTGGGGFVDFRMKVLDVDKATALFANPENVPVLIADDGKTTLSPADEVAFDADWQTDIAYYMFYANANGVIKRGSPVTVVMGDYRLEPINAQ